MMTVHRIRVALCVLALALPFVCSRAAKATEQGYFSQPAINGDRLVFTSEGDLWTVTLPEDVSSSSRLVAHRLTSSAGNEGRANISSDGAHIAFTAQYDGNADVYVMPIDGGSPTRLTYHSDTDIVVGFSPDGREVLFTSGRAHPLGRRELWSVPVTGGTPTRFGFGECSMASLSSTGKRIVFTRWSTENWTWKRYRGGTAPEIWIGDLAVGSFSNISKNKAGDQFPMWLAGRVFFASDRTGTVNIFSMQPDGSDIRQHTSFSPNADDATAIDSFDVRWPNAGSRRDSTHIVFAQAGQLALLNVLDNSVTRLNIELASDRVAERERFSVGMEHATGFDLSPSGEHLVVGMRGEVVVFPVEGGAPVRITQSSAAREWGASFLDEDGVILITDATGEQQIAGAPADGSELPGLITSDREDWLFPPVASPDGAWIAFADKTLRLHVINMQNFFSRPIDQSDVGEITDYRFSPDSQWLAYTKPLANGNSQINLYSLRTQTIVPIGDGMYADSQPRWDPAGKYLYFFSQRRFAPVMDTFDFDHITLDSTGVFALPLTEATPPPIKAIARAADFDLEAWAAPAKPEDEADDEDEAEAEDNGEVAPTEVALMVDTDGLASRVYQLPIEPGEHEQLEAIYGGVCTATRPKRESLLDDDWDEEPSLLGDLVVIKHDLVEGESEPIAEGVTGFVVSGDCSTIAWPTETGFHVQSLAGDEEHDVEVGELQLRVNVRDEWKHIFEEAWRLQRDFFWAPNMVGLDWQAIHDKYASVLSRIGTREELNDLIGEMIGELGNSHAYIWGGEEFQHATPVSVGLLGADLSVDNAGPALRIDRIIEGPSWDESLRSPLQPAHLGIKPGQFITAINGVRLDPRINMYNLMQDLAGNPVRLTVADSATGQNARTVEVTALGSERELRYWNWIETNRKYVADATDGVVGYLHIPDMGGEGLSQFIRQFYPQFHKKALIIDVRDNGGGFVSQMIIERLARKVMAYDQPRHGKTERYPYRAVNAHMVCLIDEHAGSDGDIFPAAFRMRDLGPLIGTRTWGGVVGIRGDKLFVDFGLSTQPEFAWWEAERGWSIENVGVEPDIEVEITPGDRLAGKDPQLDRAIAELRKMLEADPKEQPSMPPWPVHKLTTE